MKKLLITGIKMGLQGRRFLGNLDAERDWGFARDCVVATRLRWEDHVSIDPHYFRPSRVDILLGDASEARRVQGRTPCVDLDGLVRKMIDYDNGASEAGARACRRRPHTHARVNCLRAQSLPRTTTP